MHFDNECVSWADESSGVRERNPEFQFEPWGSKLQDWSFPRLSFCIGRQQVEGVKVRSPRQSIYSIDDAFYVISEVKTWGMLVRPEGTERVMLLSFTFCADIDGYNDGGHFSFFCTRLLK